MSDLIKTNHIKAGYSLTNPIVLCQTARTRLMFSPAIHRDGVRGVLVRQKIGLNGQWEDIKRVDFRKVGPGFCSSLELSTDATRKLFDHIAKLYEVQRQGPPRGNQELVVAPKDEVLIIDDDNKRKAIQQIINKGYSEELWELLLQTDPDLAIRLSMAKVQSDRQVMVRQFAEALTEYNTNESYWQRFFKKNSWMLEMAFSGSVFMLRGETYLGGKLSEGRQGVGGVATDFLFSDQSTKSFVVVEIKAPGSNLVGSRYRGQPESECRNAIYSMGADLSGGITQVQNQLRVALENFQSTLGSTFHNKINCIDPKAILVIGNSGDLSEEKRDSFNQFRRGFYSPTIITFDELLNRLKRLCELDEVTTISTQSDKEGVY